MFEYTTESGETPRIFTIQQLIIWRHLKDANTCNWPAQLKLANKLIKTYNNESFWTVYSTGFKLNSLAYFLTGDGKNKLFLDYNSYMLANPPKIEYSLGDKIGEDRKFEKKKSLREFLA